MSLPAAGPASRRPRPCKSTSIQSVRSTRRRRRQLPQSRPPLALQLDASQERIAAGAPTAFAAATFEAAASCRRFGFVGAQVCSPRTEFQDVRGKNAANEPQVARQKRCCPTLASHGTRLTAYIITVRTPERPLSSANGSTCSEFGTGPRSGLGPNPDFLLGSRTSASAECRHWSARVVRWSSCATLL